MNHKYDVLVIGGGHAGIEAAYAAVRLGLQVGLVTLSIQHIGDMPCNPSIGGPAKGIVVREIDAMGGLMPIAADATALQVKMLNTTKGPGVWSLRVQSDKIAYGKYVQDFLSQLDHLDLIEAMVTDLLVEDKVIKGVQISLGPLYASKVILTTGTYMGSKILRGHTADVSGPDGQPTTSAITESLHRHGIQTFRLKTGTPPRVKTASIDFSKTEVQPGSKEAYRFSQTTKQTLAYDKMWPCHLIYTNAQTHEIIHEHLNDSAMYSGLVEGVGPRYCPSIEDKLVRFADKQRHQLFLEPESASLDTTYIQGFSTSMPIEVQEQMVHSLPGLEQAEIVKYAYAIEYDAIDPLTLKPSMENKCISGLYTAGQVNGTSGYEEAAGQGLMAGINAGLAVLGKQPLILGRDEAYIGVMLDDLVRKGTKEPYRLLTSRAEYRLLLRHDNAEARLLEKAYQLGLVSEARYQQYLSEAGEIEQAKEQLAQMKISVQNEYGINLKQGMTAIELVKRPGISSARFLDLAEELARRVDIDIKYAGYIEKAKRDAAHLQAMEAKKLPADWDYEHMINLSLEARQKLAAIRPLTLGMASRIEGITPSDIAILAMHLRQEKTR